MSRFAFAAPITAIIYADSVRMAALMRRMVDALSTSDATIAGYVQHDVERPGRSNCEMVLANIATGRQIAISEDRGPGSRGCRLDVGCLTSALCDLQNELLDATDVLVLNKFGKSEAEGGGFRPVIADALERCIPIVIGVSLRNVDAWHVFAGDLAHEMCLDELEPEATQVILDRLGLSSPRPREVGDAERLSSHVRCG